MRYEDMTIDELESERDRLDAERELLRNNWMVDDPDDEWGQVNRELDRVEKLLKIKSSV